MEPVTQKDIARAAGLSTAAVSMAFHNHPSIPEETRRLVRDIAEKLGYERNPMLGALSAYRLKRRPVSFHGVLAWLYSSAAGLDWQSVAEFRAYYEGAKAKASKLGYQLVQFDVNSAVTPAKALARVLHARGIRGALICPMPRAHSELALPLERLATVAFGYTVDNPGLHRVSAHHYDSVLEIMQQLRTRGYRRIAWCLPDPHNARIRGAYLAAFFLEQKNTPPEDRLPLFDRLYTPAELVDALAPHEPDALIISRHTYARWPTDVREKILRRYGVVTVSTEGDNTLSGIDECSERIGSTGAQFLISLLEHGEIGVPEFPQHLLIQPRWQEGSTLPVRSKKQAVLVH